MSTATASKAASAIAPDPDRDPSAYLLYHGWKPQGEPRHRYTLWLDPTKPAKPIEEWKESYRRKNPKTNKEEIVQQMVITPQATPMSRDQALDCQIARDYAKEEK